MLVLQQVFFYMNWVDNMELVYIGKITSTHGIKGELKIKSSFEYKDKAFSIGNKLIIDNKEYIIKTYRTHKNFDMVTLDEYNDINQVLFLINKKVFISKENNNLNDIILDEDLVKYSAIIDDKKGIIKEVFFASSSNKIIRILINDKEILVPFNKEFIKSIDKNKKEVKIELIDGMML